MSKLETDAVVRKQVTAHMLVGVTLLGWSRGLDERLLKAPLL